MTPPSKPTTTAPSARMSPNRRAMIWAASAAAAFAAYFFIVEPALDVRGRITARADALSQTLAEVRRGAGAAERSADAVSLGRRQYGEVAMPGDPRERPIEFNRRIAEALREAGVATHESRTRPGSVARGPLQDFVAEGERLEAMVTDVEFEATPEQTSQVIAALELCPEVAAISRVQLDRAADGSRALRVTLALETWILTRGGQR